MSTVYSVPPAIVFRAWARTDSHPQRRLMIKNPGGSCGTFLPTDLIGMHVSSIPSQRRQMKSEAGEERMSLGIDPCAKKMHVTANKSPHIGWARKMARSSSSNYHRSPHDHVVTLPPTLGMALHFFATQCLPRITCPMRYSSI